MTLEPLLTASPAIQFHVATVVPAALIGGIMLLMRKGTSLHRMAGRLWIALMVLTALSSFFIHEIKLIGGFSPIHILSVVVLVSAAEVIRSARRRDFVRHQRVVKSLYFGAIGIAGLFTLLPGRIMHEVVFAPGRGDGAPVWVWPLLVALVALGISRMRDREMPVWRLLLLPAFLVSVSVLTVFFGGLNAAALLALTAGMVLGAMAGWWTMRDVEVHRLAGNRVRVSGEFVSLMAILVIFASRFAAGMLEATGSSLQELPGVAELFVLIPVLFAALMAARALAQAGFNPLRFKGRQLTSETQC
ncbi:DUF2306 domain-containing protein [Hoeflea alexandrii]|uniref:DUF2306 domain-containing protein n=1 Tax=Hoeflea alexandrii TaxID=288436 RepID=A0ABT1CLR0_9HYPH|nr:DUF2306 domain-containing protein [Hoeflea alexandrii]MCO6407141.1 DUF2306 domain-containing protein [Hoeflea alexandrii]